MIWMSNYAATTSTSEVLSRALDAQSGMRPWDPRRVVHRRRRRSRSASTTNAIDLIRHVDGGATERLPNHHSIDTNCDGTKLMGGGADLQQRPPPTGDGCRHGDDTAATTTTTTTPPAQRRQQSPTRTTKASDHHTDRPLRHEMYRSSSEWVQPFEGVSTRRYNDDCRLQRPCHKSITTTTPTLSTRNAQ